MSYCKHGCGNDSCVPCAVDKSTAEIIGQYQKTEKLLIKHIDVLFKICIAMLIIGFLTGLFIGSR